jgi:hypothetical protein
MAVIPVYFGKSRSLPHLRLCGRIISREYWISKDTHQHKKTGIQALLTVGSGLPATPLMKWAEARILPIWITSLRYPAWPRILGLAPSLPDFAARRRDATAIDLYQ